MARDQERARGPDPLGTPARRAAMRLLDAVLRRGEPLEAALPAATRAVVGPDRGLAHAIAAEALRRLPDLDALIDGATRQRLPDDAKARTALRIALVQVLALGTPPHAAIATVLPLVDGGPRRLVHGVFGAVMQSGAQLPEVATLPEAVAGRWGSAWGNEVVEGAAQAVSIPPPLDLTIGVSRETNSWAERLGGVSLAPGHVRVKGNQPVTELPGFVEGAWWVQDLAASIPARLVPEGEHVVVDVGAAPGGKCLQLASRGAKVVALDKSAARLERLRDNLRRTGLTAEVVCADALGWAPAGLVEAVLLDAPCSATGIFRRHPDNLYRARPAIIKRMAELQARLLARAAEWVRPGGTLVYATCSLEREEGEDQLARFLAARDYYFVDPVTPDELPQGVPPAPDGTIRTLPTMLADQGRLDGFFVARLRRAADSR